MNLDSLILPSIREVEPGLFSVLPSEAPPGHYDEIVGVYDRVIASAWYNRLIWGNTLAQYDKFVADALADTQGPVLDAGCGSLVFTAAEYLRRPVPVVLMDRSLGMLRRTRSRLADDHNCVVLQADLYELPFADNSFDRVLNFATAHVLQDRVAYFRELYRVLMPGKTLFLSSLVKGPRIGNWWAGVLHRRGEITEPYESAQLADELRSVGFEPEIRVIASGAYVVAQKPAKNLS